MLISLASALRTPTIAQDDCRHQINWRMSRGEANGIHLNSSCHLSQFHGLIYRRLHRSDGRGRFANECATNQTTTMAGALHVEH
jgi:hypothetical protein